MFIPTWLLVLIVVIILSAFLPIIWDLLSTLAIILFGLLVLVSMPATFYFVNQHDYQTAFVVSLPLLAIAAWCLWTDTLKSIRTSPWLHQLRVRAAATPESVEQLRRRYADDLDLGRTLFEFYDGVKYFPSWFTKTNPDGTPWTSNVIAQNEITDFPSVERAADAGIDPALLDSSDSCFVFSFVAERKGYALCAQGKGYADLDRDGEQGELYKTHAIWVVEKPSHVVLKADLTYHCGEYADSFDHAYLHSFKPGPWLPELISIAARVKKDEKEKHDRWRKDRNREQAEKHFT